MNSTGRSVTMCVASVAWFAATCCVADDRVPDPAALDQSIARAVTYLSREVAEWREQHGCYSCHNHGDGARALFAARGAQRKVADRTIDLAATWLRTPELWDHNGPDGPFSDRKLARIQFAAALTAAVATGDITDEEPLRACAAQLVQDQLPTGAWDFEGADAIGGPTTYGRALATVLAQQALRRASSSQFAEAIRRCDAWLRGSEPRSVVDAAAVLRGLHGAVDEPAIALRARCRDLLLSGQREEGGWGPYVMSGSEVFDTALVVWALAREPDPTSQAAVARGRNFLVRAQHSDGSWTETTRPLPRESYSQRVSTTAWALLALVGD